MRSAGFSDDIGLCNTSAISLPRSLRIWLSFSPIRSRPLNTIDPSALPRFK
jgi:hypothetical protein